MKVVPILAIVACLLVAVGLWIGFVAIGPPSHAREIALDERRTDDLKDISSRLRTRYHDLGSFPVTLPSIWATDPVTKRPYEYARIDRTHFALCAVFYTPSDSEDNGGTSFWSHGAGKKCYTFDRSSEPVL